MKPLVNSFKDKNNNKVLHFIVFPPMSFIVIL